MCVRARTGAPLSGALDLGLVHISVFGGRGMGLENSRCPDAFALPSCAAARSAPRGSGWLGLATPMDDSVREVPIRIGKDSEPSFPVILAKAGRKRESRDFAEVDSRFRGNDGLCPRSLCPRKRVAGNLKKTIGAIPSRSTLPVDIVYVDPYFSRKSGCRHLRAAWPWPDASTGYSHPVGAGRRPRFARW